MPNSKEVLKIFGYNSNLSSSVNEQHPHLSDKMVVDLINGIEVSRDYVKISLSRQSTMKRVLDSISSKGKKRQDAINTNMIEGLSAASYWLQKHESDFIHVNSSLEKLSSKLLETRQGVMSLNRSLNSKTEELTYSLKELEETVINKNNQLKDYIYSIDLRENARCQLNSEMDRWQAGEFEHLPVELRVFTVIDNLRHGSVALFLQKKATPNEIKYLLRNTKNKLRIRIADDLGFKPSNTDAFENIWFELEKSLQEKAIQLEDKNAIAYLSSWADKMQQPTLFSINSVLEEKNGNCPHIHKLSRWVDRNISEQLGVTA